MTRVAARDRRAAAPAVHRRPPGRWRSLRAVIGGELRAQRRAPLSWGLGLGAMTALMAAMWPSIEGSMEEMMESYPASIKEAFGIQALDTVEKYVDAEMLSLVIPLALGFFVVRRMAGALTGAEERGHLDPLLSLPLARWVLVAGTFVATGVMTAVILVVIWALTLLVGTIAGTGISALTLGEGLLSVWPLVMVFGGLATLAAGLLHHAAAVTAIGAGTLVGMYVVDLVGKLAEPLEPLRAATAFRYYGSAIQQGLDVSHLLGLTLVALLLAALGAWRFERRDVL